MCSPNYGFLSDGKKNIVFAAIDGLLLLPLMLLFWSLMDGTAEILPLKKSPCGDKCVTSPSRCFIRFILLSALSWSALGKDPMTLCSASKRYASTPPTVLGYPTVMYSGQHVLTSDTYNCSSGGRKVIDEKTLACINTNNSCPVISENIKTAVGVALWPQYVEAIRRLTETLDRAQKTPMLVNVFFLGGSMTLGAETRCTCYCSSRFDPRCPKEDDEDICTKASVCSWTKHVFKWLVEKYTRVKFTYYDFSGSGRMSQVSVEMYSTWLFHAKAQLGNNDIVFLDHSVNDADLLVFHEDLSQSFELLVRTVLFTHTQQGLAKPTVVVIEQYPHGNPRDGKERLGPNPSRYVDYARTYREVSKHYGLMLLSLREVYWTYFGLTDRNYTETPESSKSLYPISPYEHEIHVHDHPPWYIQLFVADVIADSFLYTAHRLKSGVYEKLFLPYSNNSAVPAAFYNIGNTSSRFASCDTHNPFVVDARPTNTFHPTNLTAYETDVASVGAVGWREYVDYHNTPGWIINDLSNARFHILSFPMQGVPSEGMIVKVTHLLSYVGMGMAQLYICGKTAFYYPDMDGLNNMYDKVSVPSTFVHSIRAPEAENCKALPPDQRTIGILYKVHRTTRAPEVRAKNHYKFKVLEVQVCRPAVVP